MRDCRGCFFTLFALPSPDALAEPSCGNASAPLTASRGLFAGGENGVGTAASDEDAPTVGLDEEEADVEDEEEEAEEEEEEEVEEEEEELAAARTETTLVGFGGIALAKDCTGTDTGTDTGAGTEGRNINDCAALLFVR